MTSTRPPIVGTMRFIACAVLALGLVGCSKTPTGAEGPQIEFTADARASIDHALVAYDDIRAKLARDETAAISSDARRLEQAAQDAAKSAPPSLRPTLESLSAAASTLQRIDLNDPEKVRRAFGEVSRATIALAGADSSFSNGRAVYECSMTEGYGKWLQTKGAVTNPYMGSRMLECGAEIAWDTKP